MVFYKIKNLKKGLGFILLSLSVIFLIFGSSSCSGTINNVEQYSQESTESIVEDEAGLEQIEDNYENIVNIVGMGFNDSFYVNENKVYDFSYDGNKASIQTFDIISGKKLWEWQDEWEKGGEILGADSELLYITREDYRLYAFDVNNGELKWKLIYPEGFLYILKKINSTDIQRAYFIYKGDYLSCNVCAVNKIDGSISWTIEDMGYGIIFFSETGKTLIAEKASFIGERSNLEGIDPETGETKYETRGIRCYGLAWYAWPVLEVDTEIIRNNQFLVSNSGIEIIDLDSGSTGWESNENIIYVIEVSADRIYAMTREEPAQLLVLDLQSGKRLWSRNNFQYVSLYGEEEFLGEFDGNTIITNPKKSFTWNIDSSNGNTIWENDELVLDEVIGISNDNVIGLNSKNFLYGIDIKTGEEKWKLDVSQESILKIFLSSSGNNYSGIVKNSKIICFGEEGIVVIDSSNGNIIADITVPNINSSSSFYLKENLLIIKNNSSVSIIKV